MLCPTTPCTDYSGTSWDLTDLHINCPNIRDVPNNQIPLQKVGDYWGFDTHGVTVQSTETTVFKVSSEVIKYPTIGVASFGQSPYVARHMWFSFEMPLSKVDKVVLSVRTAAPVAAYYILASALNAVKM